MNYSYYREYMRDSPAGHEIVRIAGDPSTVLQRARSIVALGEQMESAALTLARIAGAQEGAGDSLASLKDQAEEVHADLATAGARYSDSGAVLEKYGLALAEAQRVLDPIVQDCLDQWEVVQSRAASVDDAEREVVDGDTTAADAAAGRLGSAEDEWDLIAGRYDIPFETWHDAYEAAVSGLEEVNENGVSDGRWDDLLPAIELLVTVLEWAGVALVIAALIVGGPILAAIAAVVAVLALLGTIILFAKGRKDGVDLALAIVGVIPFGKLTKFGSAAADAAAAGSRFPRLTGALNIMRGADDVADARAIFRSLDSQAAAAWARGLPDVARPYNQITAGSRFFQRMTVLPDFMRSNVALDLSKDAVIGRYLGADVPWRSMSGLDFSLSFGGSYLNNVMSPLATLNDAAQSAQSDRDVDSWRG